MYNSLANDYKKIFFKDTYDIGKTPLLKYNIIVSEVPKNQNFFFWTKISSPSLRILAKS